MPDDDILERIQTLVDEEHALRTPGATADEARLAQLEVALDQCWDLLRQRRARREFGEDESVVHARDGKTVEGYQQ